MTMTDHQVIKERFLDFLFKHIDELKAQGVPVTQVEWAPPAGGNAKLADLLSKVGV